VAADQGLVGASEQLAVPSVAERGAVGRPALLEDFPAVREEEQAGSAAELLAEGLVVQRGDHGLAGARGGDDEVVAVARDALGFQGFEHGGLVGVGMEPDRGGQCVAFGVAPGGEHLDEAVAVVGLERAFVPVLRKGCLELAQDGGVVDLGEAHVPLAPVSERGVREVRGADDARGETRVAVEEPGLGVEAGAACVVAHADLGPERDERVERLVVGGAHVRGGEHP